MSKPDWFSFILFKSSANKLLLWLASVLFFVWLPVARAEQNVIREMDTAAIRSAISLGNASEKLEPYELLASGPIALGMKWEKVRMAVYTTPFLRVALAAFQAKKLFKTFTLENVTPEMIRPVLEVYAASIPREGTAIVGNVQTVIITKVGRKDPIIRPIETAPSSENWRNLFGFSAAGTGMMAVFPLEALSEQNEIHLVYDTKVGRGKTCDDCTVKFKLDKVR